MSELTPYGEKVVEYVRRYRCLLDEAERKIREDERREHAKILKALKEAGIIKVGRDE